MLVYEKGNLLLQLEIFTGRARREDGRNYVGIDMSDHRTSSFNQRLLKINLSFAP